MTNNTLTMVPAGSHYRPRSSSMYDTSSFLDSVLEKNKDLQCVDNDDGLSVPEITTSQRFQSMPKLGQDDKDESPFEQIDPMDEEFDKLDLLRSSISPEKDVIQAGGTLDASRSKMFGSLGALPTRQMMSGVPGPALGAVPGSGLGALGAVPGPLGSIPPGLASGEAGLPSLGSVPGGLGSVPNIPVGGGRRGIPGFEGQGINIRQDLGSIPPGGLMLHDSGVPSSEFAQQDLNRIPLHQFGESQSIPELEEVLSKLTPEDVEKRRKMFGNVTGHRYSLDLGSDGFESPGSLMGRPGFNFMPYGVRTPDSIMSTGSREWTGSSGYYGGASWKLPDKLRIVKPLEGSLTLHNWQRLAMPSLGGIFEERKGVYMRSRLRSLTMHGQDEALSDIESDNNEDDQDVQNRLKLGAEKLKHYDNTHVTSSYGSTSRMSSSLFSTRHHSRRSSMSSSLEDLRLVYGNIGLSNVIQERNIHGGSCLSLDHSRFGSMTDVSRIPSQRTPPSNIRSSEIASISSLTPSVMHSPDKDKSFSPTGTPLNSPIHSRSASPERERDTSEPGMVLGFFASLRAALYGEQQKEVKTLRRKHKKGKGATKKLGILEKVQEVGPERFLSPGRLTEEECSEADDASESGSGSGKAKVKYFYDCDELIDIQPGSLTLNTKGSKFMVAPDLYGELRPPDPNSSEMSGRGPGRIVSPGDKRPTLPGGFGVPGKTGTGALLRQDLGTIPVTSSGSNKEEMRLHSRPSEDVGFIGTLTTMFFGRKGGLL